MKILYYNEYILNENNSIDIDNVFLKQIKNQLTFQFKVRKNKYIKVKDVTGNIADDDIDVDIKLSNKDVISLRYQGGDLKIKINGELIYDLEEIDYNDSISLTKKMYSKFLEQKGLTVIKKENPFNK